MTHTKACLANAAISAIQNARDLSYMTDFDMRIYLQNNDVLADVDFNLNADSSLCICNQKEN